VGESLFPEEKWPQWSWPSSPSPWRPSVHAGWPAAICMHFLSAGGGGGGGGRGELLKKEAGAKCIEIQRGKREDENVSTLSRQV